MSVIKGFAFQDIKRKEKKVTGAWETACQQGKSQVWGQFAGEKTLVIH